VQVRKGKIWILNYLVDVRLGWGPTDISPSCHPPEVQAVTPLDLGLPTPPLTRPITPYPDQPPYFTASCHPSLVKILLNDWPYAVPHFIHHYVVWTRRPLIHPELVPPALWPRLQQDGLWGFTGSDYVRKPLQGLNVEEIQIMLNAGKEIELFVLREWAEDDYETAWFANPPRLQSIPGLAHFHVFARQKSNGEPIATNDVA